MVLSAMAALLMNPNFDDRSVRTAQDEISINEGSRPSSIKRTYEGACGSAAFAVEIAPGPLAAAAIRDLRIGRNSLSRAVKQANAALRDVPGSAVDAVIDRCEQGRARVRIDISDPANRKLLQIRSFWLSSDGSISKLQN